MFHKTKYTADIELSQIKNQCVDIQWKYKH